MIGWIVSGLVIIAMALMTHQKRACFIFFTIANLVWYSDLLFVQPPPIQWEYVGLVTVYFLFNVYGWFTWGKKAKLVTSARPGSQQEVPKDFEGLPTPQVRK